MSSSTASASPAEPKNEQEIISTYRTMQSEMQSLIQHLTKVEMERNEHRWVTLFVAVFIMLEKDDGARERREQCKRKYFIVWGEWLVLLHLMHNASTSSCLFLRCFLLLQQTGRGNARATRSGSTCISASWGSFGELIFSSIWFDFQPTIGSKILQY